MSRFLDRRLPPIDAHAHIAPDVTSAQLSQLGQSVTFAVTRTLEEAEAVRARSDHGLIWGCGVHPGVPDALRSYDEETFKRLVEDFVLVGEVGLDRKPTKLQQDVLNSLLAATSARPVLVSLHSAGCPEAIVEVIEAHRPAGAILHWFTGSPGLVERAAVTGAFFSVNSSAKDDLLRSLPPERILTETDFPATRRSGSRRPADVEGIENRLAATRTLAPEEMRRELWRNLRSLVTGAGALGRLDADIATKLISA